MAAGPFDSAWLKWGRAVIHAHALEADIEAAAADIGAHGLLLGVRKYDPKRHGFSVYVTAVAPLPVTWGLLLGDVANNYRSALDHLAWAIVGRGRHPNLTKQEAKRVYFPIANTRKDFNASVKTMLIGARRADRAIVRRYQPYLSGDRKKPFHCFAILASLCNDDKHRAIRPVPMMVTQSAFQVTKMRDCILSPDPRRRVGRTKPLEVGTEIGLLRVRKTGPDPQVEVQPSLFAQPAVNDRVPVDTWLAVTRNETAALLYEFAPPPLSSLAELREPRFFFPPT